MQRIHLHSEKPIPFYFRQSREDFIVDEVPLERSGGRGSYLIVKVSKIGLSTIEMLKILEEALHCHTIGYAGLKDKASTSTQYLSIPIGYSRELDAFSHPKIQILETFRHNKRIGLGDLKGNHFFIRLKEVSAEHAVEMKGRLDVIMCYGMPNYFGYQRFGRESGNREMSREIAYGERLLRDKKMQKLLGHAYQSHLFNEWLSERVMLSRKVEQGDDEQIMYDLSLDSEQIRQLHDQPNQFRVFPGDILLDKRSARWMNVTDLQAIRKGYKEQRLVPTGLLSGRKAWRAKVAAGVIEAKYDDVMVTAQGDRREAWVYPKEIRSSHRAKEGFFELSFFLPKGAYATVLLENLANRDLG